MRVPTLILAALAAASPLPAAAAAPGKLGSRTAAPEQAFEGIAAAPLDAELERQAAEASVHALGTVANPVRVGGPEGERAYLARLRCSDGAAPRIGARSAAGVGPYGSVTASYALDCGAAQPGATTVVLDMYHEEHRETRPPLGFRIGG